MCTHYPDGNLQDASGYCEDFKTKACFNIIESQQFGARCPSRVRKLVDGPPLATLEREDLKDDLKPHDSSPLSVHYLELQLAIFRYRPDEIPPGELQERAFRVGHAQRWFDAGISGASPLALEFEFTSDSEPIRSCHSLSTYTCMHPHAPCAGQFRPASPHR